MDIPLGLAVAHAHPTGVSLAPHEYSVGPPRGSGGTPRAARGRFIGGP